VQTKQDRKCTYHVTLRRVRVTIAAMETKKCYIFRVCVGSLNYPGMQCAELFAYSGYKIFFPHIQ